MSAAAQIEAARLLVVTVADALAPDSSGARTLQTVIALLTVAGTAAAEGDSAIEQLAALRGAAAQRKRDSRTARRATVTPSVTGPSRDASRDSAPDRPPDDGNTEAGHVTGNATVTGQVTRQSRDGLPSALPSLSSLQHSGSSAAESSGKREEKSARESRDVSRDRQPHVCPVVPRATRDDEPPDLDPDAAEVDATAAVLSKVGLLGVSPKDVERVRRAMPLLRTLAAARGCGPGDVLRAAKARFDAAEAAGGKVLGYPVLFSQLERWAEQPAPPREPPRLLPLAPPPVEPDPDQEAINAEGLALLTRSIGRRISP